MSDLTIEMMEKLSLKYAKTMSRDIKKLDENTTLPSLDKVRDSVYDVIKKIVSNKL